MKIYKDKYYNMDCIKMIKNDLSMKIIPDIGFKIASIKYKDKEFLFQPTKLEYKIPEFNKPFEDYDTSGLDEMIPTIDSCLYEGNTLPDHGDVWNLPWDVELVDGMVRGKIDLRSLPLKFEKTISIDKHIIQMDYCVKNISGKEQCYLWALHGLNNFNDDTEIILPQGTERLLDVINNKIIDRDIDDLLLLKKYEDKSTYKYYIMDELKSGECGLYYKDCGIKYMIKFDKNINPYLGLWITNGGFKGEYNCALEPSNGFYDDLVTAKRNNKYEKLSPNEEKRWSVFIEIVDNKYLESNHE